MLIIRGVCYREPKLLFYKIDHAYLALTQNKQSFSHYLFYNNIICLRLKCMLFDTH